MAIKGRKITLEGGSGKKVKRERERERELYKKLYHSLSASVPWPA